jgi:hypothetical protein
MIKPTMSHAVNKIHLNELLVEWFQIREKELLGKIGELELKLESTLLDGGHYMDKEQAVISRLNRKLNV